LFISADAIHRDDAGHFVWKILNWKPDAQMNESGRLLHVKKMRIVPGDLEVPFLGQWMFREASVNQDEEFDPRVDVFAGELILPPDAGESWSGDTILFARDRWLMRPGDLVGVDLTGRSWSPGLYVPMDAILSLVAKTYVFAAVRGEDGREHARRVEVEVFDGPGTLKRIQPLEESPLSAGERIIVGGVHYVQDDEPIIVARETEVSR